MTVYRGRNGERYILGEKMTGRGEGDIFFVEGKPDVVAKIYHDKKFQNMESMISNPRTYMRDKIFCMLDSPFDGYMSMYGNKRVLAVAWPQDILYDGGKFTGFVMPRASSSKTIHAAYRPIERPALFSHYTWKTAITIAHNLAVTIDYLHANDIIVGDLNNGGVLVDKNCAVTLVDADSVTVSNRSGKTFKCMVGFPTMLAPELRGKNLAHPDSVFTKQSDSFSLGIIIFELLSMSGTHPFSGSCVSRSLASPIESRIENGECAYVTGSLQRGDPATTAAIRLLPREVRALFDRTFSYTRTTATSAAVINRRPSADEWSKALHRLHGQPMNTCGSNQAHIYPTTMRHCPWCINESRYPVPRPWRSMAKLF